MPRRTGKAAKKERFMSLHSSLKSASKITAKRNVLKRFERIDILRERGKWKEGDRAYGLPKTKPSLH
jgi:small basic protein (TIGR04137 family)